MSKAKALKVVKVILTAKNNAKRFTYITWRLPLKLLIFYKLAKKINIIKYLIKLVLIEISDDIKIKSLVTPNGAVNVLKKLPLSGGRPSLLTKDDDAALIAFIT